jgi:hypothetical protein
MSRVKALEQVLIAAEAAQAAAVPMPNPVKSESSSQSQSQSASSSSNSAGDAKSSRDGGEKQMFVRLCSGIRKPVKMKVKRTTPLDKMAEAYAKQVGIQVDSFKLLVDGKRIWTHTDSSQPGNRLYKTYQDVIERVLTDAGQEDEDLYNEEGMQFDVVVEQTGGSSLR